MITLQQYFGPWWDHPDATAERKSNAERLLACCERLEALALVDGVAFPDHPHRVDGLHVYADESNVSGQRYGGFRPQACPEGAPGSSHKQGLAVDRWDPHGAIDAWCLQNAAPGGRLEQCGIYIEHPSATDGWSHVASAEELAGVPAQPARAHP